MNIKEVSTHFFTGKAFSSHPGKIALDFTLRNEEALNGGGNLQFLAILLCGALGFHQPDTLQQRGTFSSQSTQHIMAYAGKIARNRTTVEIEYALYAPGRLLNTSCVPCPEGNSDQRFEFVQHD